MSVVDCDYSIPPAPERRPRGRKRSLARKTANAIGHHVSDVLENEEFASRPGLLQGIEPTVKLLCLLAFAVTVSLIHSVALLAALVGISMLLARSSRVGVGSFARKVWTTAGLLALMLAIPATTAWITPGRTLATIGPLTLTVPGALGALTLVLRVTASAGVALLIIWTTRWTDLLQALTALKVPDIVVATLAMTQKQIVSLMRTVQQIHLARESRMLSAGTTSDNRTWVVGRMAFVVHKSVKTADDVYDAMLARGFTGAVRSIRRTAGGAASWLLLAAVLALCSAVVLIDRVVIVR